MILYTTPDLNTADNRARIQAAKQEYDAGITDTATECYWHSRNVQCDDCRRETQ